MRSPRIQRAGYRFSPAWKVGERAQAEAELAKSDVRVFVQSMIITRRNGHTLLSVRGLLSIRYYSADEIKLQEALPAVTFPDGIELRPFCQRRTLCAVCRLITKPSATTGQPRIIL